MQSSLIVGILNAKQRDILRLDFETKAFECDLRMRYFEFGMHLQCDSCRHSKKGKKVKLYSDFDINLYHKNCVFKNHRTLKQNLNCDIPI